jgi:hypothetical protein
MNGLTGLHSTRTCPGRQPRVFDRSVSQRAGAGIGLIALLALGLSAPVRAEETPLTLAETQRIATLRSKQIEAGDLGVSASKDLTVAASERPDPIAKIGLENLPINGPEAFSVNLLLPWAARVGWRGRNSWSDLKGYSLPHTRAVLLVPQNEVATHAMPDDVA